jgi:hypothetical protein
MSCQPETAGVKQLAKRLFKTGHLNPPSTIINSLHFGLETACRLTNRQRLWNSP